MGSKRIALSLLAVLIMASHIIVHPATSEDISTVEVALTAVADSWTDQSAPARSFGRDDLLTARSSQGQNGRIYVAFDLSSLPLGAAVISARLSLYAVTPPPSQRTYSCLRVSSPWDEGSVSWGARPQTTSIYATSTTVGTSAGWVTWDVTAQVQRMLNGISEHAWDNYGWEISDSNEDSTTAYATEFHSRETSETSKPTLTIRFTPPKIDLETESSSMMTGTWIQVIAKRVSQDGVIVVVGDRTVKQNWISKGNLVIHLSSTSASGKFSAAPGGQVVDRLTILDGSTQITFYYFDDVPGSVTISAVAGGYQQGYYIGDSESVEVAPDTIPPRISNVMRSPEGPVMGDSIQISASVDDPESGVKDVTLRYSVGGGTWTEIAMTLHGDRYISSIPSQNPYTEVRYQIRSSDNTGNTSETSIETFSVGLPLWMYGVVVLIIAALLGLRARGKETPK